MLNRKQKIEELMENFGSLKRDMAFRGVSSPKVPRITPSQWGALILIERRGETSIKDIADALRISSSAATQLVDGLVESGYVVRGEHEKDRRIIILTLSKKTKNKIEKMKEQMVQKFLDVFEALTDAELNQYCILNKKIMQRFLNEKHN